MDNTSLFAVIASISAGMATAVGALPIFFKKKYSKESLDIGMAFSAGVMLIAAFFSLLIPGFESSYLIFGKYWSVLPVLAGVFLGYISIILFHNVLPHEHIYKETDMDHKRQFSRVTLIVLAITLHNIPEGLAVGVGFGTENHANGFIIALAMAIQNMPEGLVVALGLLSEGATRKKSFYMATLSGAVEPVAALFGFLMTQVTHYVLPVALGFAAGAMLFVVCQEIFPELFRKGQEKRTTLGVISGIILMLLIDQTFKALLSL